jgi:hypothetical protein
LSKTFSEAIFLGCCHHALGTIIRVPLIIPAASKKGTDKKSEVKHVFDVPVSDL